MWILPKQLHTLVSALDTEALILDLNEQSRVCEQSLLVRSKPSPLRTWLQRWKRDSWTRHLSGRILRPSLGNAFARKWTCYLADIHVSRSQARDSAKEKTIRGISGRGLQMELGLFDQPSVSSRTSKDISAWGCPTSSKTWQEWVTERRGAYSQRLNAVRRTSGNGYSSWPSPVASEVRQGFQDRSRGMKGSQESLTTVVIKDNHGPPDPASSSTDGSRQGLSQESRLWMTPKSGACGMTATTSGRPLERSTQLTTQVHVVEKQWQTATVSTGAHKQKDGSMIDKLDQQVKSWATPCSRDHHPNGQADGSKVDLGNQVLNGKLNPRWVETLMGLPVGWTMPSCASPVTIGPMNSGSWGME